MERSTTNAAKCIGALLFVLLTTAGAAQCYYSYIRGRGVDGKEVPFAATDEPRRQQGSKQERRAARIASRRASKDARLEVAKAARSRQIALERNGKADEELREEMERIKMRRVEQYQKLESAMLHGVRVVVDLSFLETQNPREQQSVFKQLGCFYGYLKQCPLDSLLSLRVASCGTTFEVSALCQQHGLASWKIWRHDAPVERVYSVKDLVFLSPDADEVLQELDPSSIYVVGAIADRTVRKGETAASAMNKGLQSVRLPVREHLAGARTHVLNIDAVLVALNEFANHRDWSRAFARAVPKRIATGRRAKKSETSPGKQPPQP